MKTFSSSSPFKLSVLQHLALLSEALNYIPVFTPPTTQNQTFFTTFSAPAATRPQPHHHPNHQLPAFLQNRLSSEALDYSISF
ncbi:hypothetical protein, partial [Acidovorax radicis]|uniref:hypothetical protein n=2 Tax=Acidovorax radicis TaxID=758826 RepID=UPI001AD7F0D7